MLDAKIEHEVECSAETFWRAFFDADYNRQLFQDVLGFPTFEQRSFEETDQEIRRVIHVVPKVVGVPGPLKAVVGEGLAYTEEGRFDKAGQRFRIRVAPSKMADRVNIEGAISTVPMTEKRCRRLFEVSVRANVFGVGGLLERQIVSDLEKSNELAARFTGRFVAERNW
jgi:hypothetical protein